MELAKFVAARIGVGSVADVARLLALENTRVWPPVAPPPHAGHRVSGSRTPQVMSVPNSRLRLLVEVDRRLAIVVRLSQIAESLLSSGHPSWAATTCYYSCFFGAQAMLNLHGVNYFSTKKGPYVATDVVGASSHEAVGCCLEGGKDHGSLFAARVALVNSARLRVSALNRFPTLVSFQTGVPMHSWRVDVNYSIDSALDEAWRGAGPHATAELQASRRVARTRSARDPATNLYLAHRVSLWELDECVTHHLRIWTGSPICRHARSLKTEADRDLEMTQ